MTFEFAERDYDPLTLSSVIGQAVGAGSVCWENMEGTGVFQSNHAVDIINTAIAWIEEHYVLKSDVPGFLLDKRLTEVADTHGIANGPLITGLTSD